MYPYFTLKQKKNKIKEIYVYITNVSTLKEFC